jgi:hypothetical protein
LAVDEWVVNYRRKEIDRLDDGEVIGEAVDSRVVVRGDADD